MLAALARAILARRIPCEVPTPVIGKLMDLAAAAKLSIKPAYLCLQELLDRRLVGLVDDQLTVLEPDELAQLIAAGQEITKKFTPVTNAAGQPKPWDIEFGFKDGKLWLFQCRPFLGNDDLKNVPALAALDVPTGSTRTAKLSLDEVLR